MSGGQIYEEPVVDECTDLLHYIKHGEASAYVQKLFGTVPRESVTTELGNRSDGTGADSERM